MAAAHVEHGGKSDGGKGTLAKAAMAEKSTSKAGCFYWVTTANPTNYDMLVFRTLNRELNAPYHNQDHMAAAIRSLITDWLKTLADNEMGCLSFGRDKDHLMPVRGWWLRTVPWAKYQMQSAFENKWWGVPGCINFIDARTKWFDYAVTGAIEAGIKQVVVVAAGYDTRAYRLGAPGVRFFEVDLPSASTRKAALVKDLKLLPEGVPSPTYVAANLAEMTLAQALEGTGFDPSIPTLFTIEGLIYYLPPPAAEALIAYVCQLAATGSRVCFDFMHSTALSGAGRSPKGWKYGGFKVTSQAVANKGEPYLFGLEDSEKGVISFLAAASAAASSLPPLPQSSFPAGRTTNMEPSRNNAPAGALGSPPGLQLIQYLDPKDMMAAQLPKVKWNDNLPPIAAFYSYAAAQKV